MIELILAKLAEKTTRYIAIALAAVLLLVGTYVKGRNDGYTIASGECVIETMKWQAKVDQVIFETNAKIKQIVDEYEGRNKDLQKELDKLKDLWNTILPPGSNPTVTRGFVIVHNTAASGQATPTTIPNSQAQSDKRLSDVGRVVTTNYYECNMIRNQLQSLQDVVRNYQEKQRNLVK